MLFSEEFLTSLTSDPMAGTEQICDVSLASISSGQGWNNDDYENLLEAITLLSETGKAGMFPFTYHFNLFPPTRDMATNCQMARQTIDEIKAKCLDNAEAVRVEKLRSKFKAALSSGFKYEFSQGDLEKVQALINE